MGVNLRLSYYDRKPTRLLGGGIRALGCKGRSGGRGRRRSREQVEALGNLIRHRRAGEIRLELLVELARLGGFGLGHQVGQRQLRKLAGDGRRRVLHQVAEELLGLGGVPLRLLDGEKDQ